MPVQQSADILKPLERRSAPATPFPSQRPASSHTVGSRRPDNPDQMPLGLESHPRPPRLPKRKRTFDRSALDDGESAALADMAKVMEVVDHLIQRIQTSHNFTKVTEDATKLIIADESLTEDQRATLCIYYGKSIPEAATLAFMDYPLRHLVFKKILGI